MFTRIIWGVALAVGVVTFAGGVPTLMGCFGEIASDTIKGIVSGATMLGVLLMSVGASFLFQRRKTASQE